MLEDPKKKVTVLLIAITALVILFLVGMRFINKATVKVTAQAPYAISIEGVGQKSCSVDTCKMSMEKGNYTVSLQKSGYKYIEFNVSLGRLETFEKEAEFELIPYMAFLTQEEGEKIFNESGESAEVYLDQEEGHKQALYLDGEVAAYFNVPVEDFDLSLLGDGKTIALIGHSDTDSLYLIDSEEKSRKKVFEDDNIFEIECSPGVEWCVVQGSEVTVLNSDRKLSVPLSHLDFYGDTLLYFVSQDSTETGLVSYVQVLNFETMEEKNIFTSSEISTNIEQVKASDRVVYLRTADGYLAVKF
ncbi:MAG: hypothetical protein ABH856_04730 [Patescibacteria group bacterium]|nr:hypothetical protein [Patescibacteria group bacterium]